MNKKQIEQMVEESGKVVLPNHPKPPIDDKNEYLHTPMHCAKLGLQRFYSKYGNKYKSCLIKKKEHEKGNNI